MNDAQIKEALTKYKKIAVIGLSPDPHRASNGVTKYMIREGYEIVGVRPETKEILGKPCYSRIEDVPRPLEIVDVFRRSDAVPEIVDIIIPLKPKLLWLQLGVTHPEAEAKAEKAGILVVSNKCILQEHARLFHSR